MSSTFNTKPGFRPQVSLLVGKLAIVSIATQQANYMARCHLCSGELTIIIH